jgi:hypothetical protein
MRFNQEWNSTGTRRKEESRTTDAVRETARDPEAKEKAE